jgi:two-component system, OmpR family, sensor histidine kinase MtrB
MTSPAGPLRLGRIPWPGPLAGARDAWARSLLLRVVATTLVLSIGVVVLVGAVLLDRIRDGLLDAKVQASVAEASAGVETAQRLVDASDQVEPSGAAQLIDQIAVTLAGRAGTPSLYEVLLLASPGTTAAPQRGSSLILQTSVPPELRTTVQTEGVLAWTFTTVQYVDGRTEPGLVVGAPLIIDGVGTFELYYVFPLTAEQATLDLVQNGIALAGVVLVALLSFIAWFVTRSVVTPVRLAADVAERLANGRLEERMQVRGEDELAKLANAFNAMASNIKRQIRQLEDLSRVQRRFVADVSHELRTPITTIRMAADVLYAHKDELEEPAARASELLIEQLDRFEDLLTELLEISRFDAGSAILDADPVDLRSIIDRVMAGAELLARANGTEMRRTEPPTPCLVECDTVRVERILRNLVVNAVEHGEGRPIDVVVAADDDAAAITVRDRGVGLRPGESALVFNRFWRSDPSRARTTGGTGLGLSIALEDARLHGGWLEAWGEPGRGSVFRLTLPRRLAVPLTASPLPLEPPEYAGARAALEEIGEPYRQAAGADPSRKAGDPSLPPGALQRPR